MPLELHRHVHRFYRNVGRRLKLGRRKVQDRFDAGLHHAIDDLLRFVSENPDRSGKRDIARAFSLKGDDRIWLKQMLRDLEDEGLLEKSRKRLIRPGSLPHVVVLDIFSRDPDGRLLAKETREPVVRLDDLLTILRRGPDTADSQFGCSINPRQDSLAKTRAFLASTSQRPLQPGQRKAWLGKLRDTVGLQDIEVFGVDPASRVARYAAVVEYTMAAFQPR